MQGLSPSVLGNFKNCPRCFWNAKNRNIKQPEGIKASLPKGMDEIMKKFVDGHVAAGLEVPWLRTVPGNPTPFKDRTRLKQFMNWRTFQAVVTLPNKKQCKLWGIVDDVIEHENGMVSPWDFKTKGTEPNLEYGQKYYQNQLDIYHILLEAQGLKCTGKGYLSYGWPDHVEGDEIIWGWKNLDMDTDPDRPLKLIQDAVDCLEGPEPEGSCEFCQFIKLRS